MTTLMQSYATGPIGRCSVRVKAVMGERRPCSSASNPNMFLTRTVASQRSSSERSISLSRIRPASRAISARAGGAMPAMTKITGMGTSSESGPAMAIETGMKAIGA